MNFVGVEINGPTSQSGDAIELVYNDIKSHYIKKTLNRSTGSYVGLTNLDDEHGLRIIQTNLLTGKTSDFNYLAIKSVNDNPPAGSSMEELTESVYQLLSNLL